MGLERRIDLNYLIGLDIGTSSVKGVLLTTKGRVEKTVKEVFTYKKFENGGLELVPGEYLEACMKALRKLAEAAVDGEIKGVCASSASGNLLVLDKEGRPSTGIIGWQDKRVTDEAREILGEMDLDAFYDQIGWPFSYKTFPLAQLCYIKKHQPKVLEACGTVCMSTEYLYYALTGKWGISTSAGTTFFLMDQKEGRYIDGLLDVLGIDESKLPPIMPCGTVLGGIKKEMEEVCGIPAGTPVVLGSFDHPSAARGVGVLKEGEMLLSCGTSWVAFFPIASRDKGIRARMLVDPFLAPAGGCYGAMSSLSSLSGKIQRYVHRYIDDSAEAYQKLSALCRESVSGANGLCISPLEEPDDERILKYPKEDIARAIMEGTVGLLKDKLDMLAAKGITAQSAVMVGGPSEDPMWISLIEEICGISVRVIHGAFAGAVGAAVIAGVGIGEHQSEEDYSLLCNKSHIFNLDSKNQYSNFNK